MPRPSGQSGPRPAGHPLNTFVTSRTESLFARSLAENSTLPGASLHRDPLYRGIDPASVDTSRSVNKDRSTHLESVPTLDSTCQTLPSASEPTTAGAISDCIISAVIEGPDGVPIVDHDGNELPQNQVDVHVGDIRAIPRQEPPMLVCPFSRLGCNRGFDIDMVGDWIDHSLDHYIRDDFGLDRAEPPRRNQCPFCLESFVDVNGEASWVQRMEHVSFHHRRGSRDVRTDFMLYSHLWRIGVIDIDTFRDICGPRAHPSYGARNQTSGATTPGAAAERGNGVQGPEEAVSVMNERRRGSRRRHR